MSALLPPDPDQILTPDDVAKILDVSRDMLIRWALADYGPPVFIMGNHFRYRRREVMEWRDKNWKRDRFAQAG